MSVIDTSSRAGKQYLGNKNTKEVHDLYKEQTNCQIDEILDNDHGVMFIPDTLSEAHRNGYDNCAYCIGSSTR
jgi:hypothetical protein